MTTIPEMTNEEFCERLDEALSTNAALIGRGWTIDPDIAWAVYTADPEGCATASEGADDPIAGLILMEGDHWVPTWEPSTDLGVATMAMSEASRRIADQIARLRADTGLRGIILDAVHGAASYIESALVVDDYTREEHADERQAQELADSLVRLAARLTQRADAIRVHAYDGRPPEETNPGILGQQRREMVERIADIDRRLSDGAA